MEIVKTSVFVGPNYYSANASLRVLLDVSDKQLEPNFIDKFCDLVDDVSGKKLDRSSIYLFVNGQANGYTRFIAILTKIFQDFAGGKIAMPETGYDKKQQLHYFMCGYESDEVGIEAAYLITDLLNFELGISHRNIDEFKDDFEDFIYFAERRALGPSTMSMIEEAERRGIPWVRLNDRSLVQFGYGKYQKRIEATVTSNTSLIACEIASDKELTNRIMDDLGLPVPRQKLVYTLKAALRSASKLGYPLVAKPQGGNHGRGVTLNINSDQELEDAYDLAREFGDAVILESMIEGFDHRMLVIDGKLVAASRRMPAHVVGNGKDTIAELVNIVNSDPRRGVGHEKELTQIKIDEAVKKRLKERKLDLRSIPKDGELIILQETANLSTGGTAIDVTDEVHPVNREMAERAIKAVGLDIGGVDFLTPDISKSFRKVGGAICEINAGPGFRMHTAPSEGKPRNVAEKVLETLFPKDENSTIPIAAITGTNGKTTTSRMLAHILKMSGHKVGLTTTDAVYIDGNLSMKGDMTGPTAARMVLRDPSVDAAVLETARGGILRAGLGFKECNVGAVLNISEDHLGLGGIDTIEELAEVKSLIVKVAKDTAVLNADEDLCLQMANKTKAKSIFYVSMKESNALVLEHIRLGFRAAVLERHENGDYICFYDGNRRIQLIRTNLIPATIEGKAIHNVQNAMFAAALAYSLGKSIDDIRQGLRTFDTSFFQVPGRMNIYDQHPFTTILDYGHNPAAIGNMMKTIDLMKVANQKTVVIKAPGDRRDDDIKEIGRIIAGHFDNYILDEDDDLRGRKQYQISGIIKDQLLENGVLESQIKIIPNEPEAVDYALNYSKEGDLLLIFGENISRCWKQIIYFNRKEEEISLDERDNEEITKPLNESVDSEEAKFITDERGVRMMK